MALELLGSKYCIDSLREDVTDLQDAIIDVFSRAGPARVPSWKYPDKCASDLDMTELLELYDYSEDQEDRQIAHIVLLELVIDRLLLLLQAMNKFMDQSQDGKSKSSPAQNKNSTSIGLVVKKYWNKLVQSQGALTQANTEVKKQKRRITDLENSLSKETEQRHELESVTETLNETLRAANTPFPLSDIDQVLSRATSAISISRDECIKATQTIETAFVPCEACEAVQKNLRMVGGQLVYMCQQQGLPSNLARCKKEMEAIDWMTANDVTRWATEQNCDLKRLEKYLSDFNSLQENLRIEKQKVKESSKKLTEFDKEMKVERETQTTQRKHYESKIQTIEKNKEEAIVVAKRQADEVQRRKQQLEKQLGELKEQYGEQKTMLQQLDTAKQKVEDELEESKTNNAEVKRLESDVDKVEAKLKEVTSQLQGAQQSLSREKARNKSSETHTQSVQNKQEQLLRRLDDLDRENDDLRNEVTDLEETKEKLQSNLEEVKDERRKLKEKHRESEVLVKQLRRDKDNLEQSMVDLQADIHALEGTLQEAREKEQLMVEYPDLNGPVNPDLQGTGDLAKDMENQVKANTARIQLLEAQNNKLRQTITKVLQTRQFQPEVKPSAPVPLWRNRTPVQEEEENKPRDVGLYPQPVQTNAKTKVKAGKPSSRDTEKANDWADTRFSIVIGKGGGRSPEKNKSSRSRPGSAAKPGNPSSQAQLKKTILSQKGSGQSDTSSHGYRPAPVHTCARCDKLYDCARDLQIHQSYCRA